MWREKTSFKTDNGIGTCSFRELNFVGKYEFFTIIVRKLRCVSINGDYAKRSVRVKSVDNCVAIFDKARIGGFRAHKRRANGKSSRETRRLNDW